MNINVLKSEKDLMEVQIENLTIAELLRVYLNKDSDVTFAAWRREHPTKAPILKIETKGKSASKAIKDAVKVIEKELDKSLSEFKKLK